MKTILSGARRAYSAVYGLLFILIVVCTSAPSAADPAIWKVEGGPQPVWLFGTFHLLPPETDWQTKAVIQGFDNADALVVEVRLDMAAIASMQSVIAEKAFLDQGKHLRDYLSPEDQKLLERIANRLGSKFGIYPAVLDYYKPWYASLQLSVALYMEQGFRPGAGADTVLQDRAQAAGKPILQFETAIEQVNFLADTPMDAQVDMLQATLYEAETMPEQVDALLAAWESGNTKEMDRLLNDALREFPDAYDRLLIQRNMNWIPQIVPMIEDDKSYFIAVGTAHLVGKDSVVAMLRKKGYSVVRR